MMWTRTRGIHKIIDLHNVEGEWRTMEDLRGNQRSYHRVDENIVEDLLRFVNLFTSISDGPLEDCEGWEWDVPNLTFRDFELSIR